MRIKKVVPTEHQEQSTVISWADIQSLVLPELRLLFAIPNGGKRNVITATMLKREGVKAGVPDLCLPVPRGPFYGLYIEMKRRGGNTSKEQDWWIGQLIKQGYQVVVCFGAEEAISAVMQYLNLPCGESRIHGLGASR